MTQSAPSAEEVSSRFDAMIGKDLAGDLFVLFESVAANLKAMIEDAHFPQIQEYMNRFLFDPGFQEMGVRISDAGKNVAVHHDSVRSQRVFPNVEVAGDMDVLAHFFPTKIEGSNGKSLHNVNQFNGFVGMSGMPPIAIVVDKLRRLIECSSDRGKAVKYPTQMAASLLRAMQRTFPTGNKFAEDLLDMKTCELDFTPCSSGGIMASLSAELNMEKLTKLYPSMANLLKHLGDLDVSILDMHDSTLESPEQNLASAKCMMQVRIVYTRGCVCLTVNMMIPSNDGCALLWFDRTKKVPILDAQGKLMEVEFAETAQSYSRRFRVVIDGVMRIPQLGCGSIALPLLVIQLKCISSKASFPHPYGGEAPAHRFDITILHMAEKRITAVLLRPFFNLDLLRFILLHHFHIQIDIGPPSAPKSLKTPSKDAPFPFDEDFEEFFDAKEEDDGALVHDGISFLHPKQSPRLGPVSDAVLVHRRPWTFTSKVHMFLPMPPKIITSCLFLFVGEQMSSPDDLRLIIDLMNALATDLRLMHARLTNGDMLGDKNIGESIVVAVPVVAVEAEVIHVRPKRRRWFWFF